MELNWSTFLLEIINFLILVWILKHFLYKPVLDVITRRRRDIEKTLNNAKTLHNDAETLQEQYKNRLAVWEQERLAAQTELKEEIEAERVKQMEILQNTLEEEREKAKIIEQHQLKSCQLQIEKTALIQGAQFATRLLTAVAGPELERRLSDLFIQELAELSSEQIKVLRAAGKKLPDKIQITSAYPLDDATRSQLEQSLGTTLMINGPFHYTQDKALLAGLCINIGDWVLRANLQDELKVSWILPMTLEAAPSSSLLERQAVWLEHYQPGLHITEQGIVASVGDGIAWVTGLPSVGMEEILLFEDGSYAMVFDLTEELVGAVLLHETDQLTAGTAAHLSPRMLSIPVGDQLLGRIIDPLGNPLDGLEMHQPANWLPLERRSPAIMARDFVHEPLYTGIKVIDTLIPIGKGQRQLLIGDEGLGRSSVAIDTIINQRGKDVYCVYVLIGQKRSTVVNTIETLRTYDALEYTTIVAAEATALPGLQHLAPFAGCAVAEQWMQHGKDTLVVYDDLSTHAKTYRELSLLLRRPPGREAYPGDIFSVHARLLERTTCLNANHGGGSMTALPIVETQQGEIAAYIPTNLISITDGQLYLDRNLFAAGFRPAIDIAKSVSRIGGKAQHPCIKEEAGRMKLDYLQFLELELFTRFGANLEASVELAIQRGRVLREILKQNRLSPLPVEFQMAWMVAFNDGLLDKITPEEIPSRLIMLEGQINESALSLNSPREQWVKALIDWLGNQNQEHHQP